MKIKLTRTEFKNLESGAVRERLGFAELTFDPAKDVRFQVNKARLSLWVTIDCGYPEADGQADMIVAAPKPGIMPIKMEDMLADIEHGYLIAEEMEKTE